MSDRQDDVESDDTSMSSSQAATPYPAPSHFHNMSRMRSSPPPPSSLFPATTSQIGDGHRTKTVRLVVFGKPYSVPLRKIDTEKGILDYLNTIPSVQRKLKSSPGHGLKRLFANEVWEFRNEDGDTIRLEDWTDMVYGGGRLSLISNATGEEHNPQPPAQIAQQPVPMPQFAPMPQDTPINQPPQIPQATVQAAQTRSTMSDADDGGTGGATKRVKHNVEIEDELDEQGLPRMEEDPLPELTMITPPVERKTGDVQQQQPQQQQQPGGHLIINAYSNLKLPSMYPPVNSGVKLSKVSFSPRTTYGKALKALCGGNVPEGARLQTLMIGIVKGDSPEKGAKYLVAGKVVQAAEKDMLGDIGFTSHEGHSEYMVRIIV